MTWSWMYCIPWTRFRMVLALGGIRISRASSTALHEVVGFGLQTPINRYLLAAWLGLVWGVWIREKQRRPPTPDLLDEPDDRGLAQDDLGVVGGGT